MSNRIFQAGPEFVLTQDHITLLRNMYVGWQNCEYGAPEIDPKRPYGNSGVESDLAELLPHADGPQVHSETATALQIVLLTGAFVPGRYRLRNRYDSRSWERVEEGSK